MNADPDAILQRARGENCSLRMATPEDSAALCALFREISLGGSLEVLQERDPDFFRLLEMHGGPYATCTLVDDAGEIGGCGSVAIAPAWLDGQKIESGYLCDLRARPGFRGGRNLPRCYEVFMDSIRARYSSDIFTTVIFDSNIPALRALRGGGKKHRASQPLYIPVTPFEMISVQFTRRSPCRRSAQAIRVAPATRADLEELLQFLIAGQRRRRFGWRASADMFLARWESWPEFSLEDFLLARGGSDGRLLGCLAPWDTKSFKRTRVLGYHGVMKWQRMAFNLAAELRNWAPLPKPGGTFRFSFLTHLEIPDEQPQVMAALLDAVYERLRPLGQHFMSACVPRGSPVRAAFARYSIQSTAMTLYAVFRADSPYARMDLTTRTPGFEMALS
jgi:hypothetical protein